MFPLPQSPLRNVGKAAGFSLGGIDPIAFAVGLTSLFTGKKKSESDQLIELKRKFIKELFKSGGAEALYPLHRLAMSDIMNDYLMSRAAASRPILGRGSNALSEAYSAGSLARRMMTGKVPFLPGYGTAPNAAITGAMLAGSTAGTSAFNDALVRAIMAAEESARNRPDEMLQRSAALSSLVRGYAGLF